MHIQTWNDDLATKAQEYSNQCIWGHNPDRTSPLGKVGENLYLTTGTLSDYSVAVTAWDKERNDYDYSTNTCKAGAVCGHYTQVRISGAGAIINNLPFFFLLNARQCTQLVWATTNKVGCGATLCPMLTGLTFKNALLVVCSYFPG